MVDNKCTIKKKKKNITVVNTVSHSFRSFFAESEVGNGMKIND